MAVVLVISVAATFAVLLTIPLLVATIAGFLELNVVAAMPVILIKHVVMEVAVTLELYVARELVGGVYVATAAVLLGIYVVTVSAMLLELNVVAAMPVILIKYVVAALAVILGEHVVMMAPFAVLMDTYVVAPEVAVLLIILSVWGAASALVHDIPVVTDILSVFEGVLTPSSSILGGVPVRTIRLVRTKATKVLSR